MSARATFRRLAVHGGGVSARSVESLGIDGLRQLGVTRQKAGYCHGLARRILGGTLDLRSVARGSDQVGRLALGAVPGLGPWSIDIYFLMALRRPDVWPHGDLALASALREVKRLRADPSHSEQQRIAGSWSPWRSIAARMLWAHYLAGRNRLGRTSSSYRARPRTVGT